MISKNKGDTVTIVLDGEEVDVPAGSNLVDAAALHSKEIPHYCYHPQLSVAGNCRMCLIEMGTPMRDRETGEPVLDEDGVPKDWLGSQTSHRMRNYRFARHAR